MAHPEGRPRVGVHLGVAVELRLFERPAPGPQAEALDDVARARGVRVRGGLADEDLGALVSALERVGGEVPRRLVIALQQDLRDAREHADVGLEARRRGRGEEVSRAQGGAEQVGDGVVILRACEVVYRHPTRVSRRMTPSPSSTPGPMIPTHEAPNKHPKAASQMDTSRRSFASARRKFCIHCSCANEALRGCDSGQRCASRAPPVRCRKGLTIDKSQERRGAAHLFFDIRSR